ncbi:MAG TPA: DUF4331 family protein [Candidatus Baltobacteraceae bacterium]|jgi:hypothetical protein
MKLSRVFAGVFAVVLLAVAITVYSTHAARSSDHQDSPTIVANPMEDITDSFAFPAPDNPANVVFVVDFCPLIPVGCNSTFDPNVLYQIKLANVAGDPKEHLVIQMKANTAGTNPTFTLYGPSAPNEQDTKNTLVAQTGTFNFNDANATVGTGIKVFVGTRHDPFFFDLTKFFKILPDRNYKNQPNPPKGTATSFNFPDPNANVNDVLGNSYGKAGALGCDVPGSPNYSAPSDFLQPYNVMSWVVSVPKTMLVPAGGTPGKIGMWVTASTPSGS